jgi:SAM-dependent methyltransferase
MFLRTDAAAWVLVPLHALGFAVTALVCHQALAASRPPAERATEFYLMLAVGGALGGLFNVFVAPLVFRGLYEYPIGLAAAALLRPVMTGAEGGAARAARRDLGLPAALGAFLLAGVAGIRAAESRLGPRAGLVALVLVLSAAGTAVYAFRARPWRFGLALAALMAAGATYQKGGSHVLYAARSFYGAHKVLLDPPSVHRLAHGNTTHGAQNLAPDRRREPLTYYHPTGPIGGVLEAWRGRPARGRVGVVGLGAGSLAAYAAPGEHWTFFEIDPAVIDIARDRGFFTFLADAPAAVDVRLGDARLSLARVSDGELGILVLDAFTSDAVPAHLLTREAFALYLRKLAPGGVIAIHLSNRYLDLEPVVAGGAAAFGATGLVRFDSPTEAEARRGKTASLWMVVARSPADLAPIASDPRWRRPRQGGNPGWTDDASDLWRALRLTGL